MRLSTTVWMACSGTGGPGRRRPVQAVGAALRSVAGGIATLSGLVFVALLLLDLLPGTLRATVGPYIPMASGEQVYIAVRHEAGQLGAWSGFGVFCLYAAAALVAGFTLVDHRDA